MRWIIETQDSFNGYNFITRFFEDGHRAGYIEIPEGHKYYALGDFDTYYGLIDCHGGVTFAGKLPDEMRRLGFFIGFDYAHSCDVPDLELAARIFGENYFVDSGRKYGPFHEPSRQPVSLQTVIHECIFIIGQLVATAK